jgi:hypothetical protein
MSIVLHHSTRRLIQRRLQRLSRPRLLDRFARRTVPGRVTPMERVMLRSSIHVNRSFEAYVNLQALLSAGTTRHTDRVETMHLRERAVSLPALRQLERVLVTQRVLHERLIQRLTVSTSHAAPPRVAMLTRVEHRNVFPRVQLTLVRTQAAVASAPRVAPDASVPVPGMRTAPAQPRGATTLPPLVLPPQELSRLTDHVIRQLDHRVLSYQERTGRV